MAEKPKLNLKTIVARVIVAVMFGLLILSFAVWGIGDIFRRGIRVQSVAEVGSVRIMPQEFQEQYRREVRRLQTMLQTDLSADRARELGLPQQVLQDMISRAVFDIAARDAGVAVSDDVVRQSIFDNPTFHNKEGKFDRRIFEGLIFNAGYNEDRFASLMRQDLVRNQVIEAVTAGGVVSRELLNTLYLYRNERRTAETIVVAAAAIKNVPPPTEADLEAYHKDHAEAYTAPEFRAITAVEIQPEALAARMKATPEKVKDEYEARIAEFKVPEERALRQIIVKDEESAKRAADLLAKGESFEKAAQDVAGKPPLDLGTVKETDIASPEIAAAAFELKENAVTAPIATPLGWHIVQVTKIVPGRTQSLEEAKDKLAHELALREAADAVFDLGNKLQDALGGGASLEDAAQKLALKLVKLEAVDSKGLGPDGKPVPALPKGSKFLSSAFSAGTGRESDLIDDGQGGYFMLRVDKVEPGHLRALAEVRDKVLAGWQDAARRKAAEKTVAGLAEKAKAGTSLAELAKQGGYGIVTTKPFTRTGQGAETVLTPDLVASLFAAKTGDIVTAPSPQGATLAKLLAVMPAELKADEDGVKRLGDQLLGAIDADLLGTFGNALRAQYGVEINSSVVDSLLGS